MVQGGGQSRANSAGMQQGSRRMQTDKPPLSMASEASNRTGDVWTGRGVWPAPWFDARQNSLKLDLETAALNL